MAKEQREARGSLGNMRLGRLRVPDAPELAPAAFVFRAVVAGFVGGLRDGATGAVGNGTVFSKSSRPRVGGADSARAIGAGFALRLFEQAGGGGGAIVVIFGYLPAHNAITTTKPSY